MVDLFSRFTPGTKPGPPDDDSGLGYASRTGRPAGQLGEAELLAAVDRVPPMPVVVSRILTRVGDSEASVGDIVDLVRQDMVIAGRLLHLVNSPFYGLSQHVSSIPQALSLIGFASVKSLVLAASFTQLLEVDLSAYGFSARGLWRHSIATAAVARSIAQRSGLTGDAVEELFVAGLIRDVGMLVLAPFLTARQITLRKQPGESDVLRRERAAIGFDHCWAGERVAEKWQLPARLRLCIAKHHRIPAQCTPEETRLLAAVRLAERLVTAARVGLLADHPFESTVDGVLILASGLPHQQFQELVHAVPKMVKASATDFG